MDNAQVISKHLSRKISEQLFSLLIAQVGNNHVIRESLQLQKREHHICISRYVGLSWARLCANIT